MSILRKKIERVGRTDRPALGFRPVAAQKPRAMLLGTLARNGKEAKALAEAAPDVVLVPPAEVMATAKALEAGACIGALTDALDVETAERIRAEGADFIVSAIAGTAAGAVDTDSGGFVPRVTGEEADTLLRTLGPTGADAIAVEAGAGLSLAEQLALIRVGMMAGAPLLVLLTAAPSIRDLRVLRDAGAAVIVAPEGSSADQLRELGAALREVPPKKRRDEGGGAPMVPLAGPAHSHSTDEPGEEDGDDDD